MKKNRKIIIIVGVIIGLLVIGIVVFLMFKKNNFTTIDSSNDTNIDTTIDTSVKNSNSEYKISDNALSSFDLYFMQKENNKKNKVYSPLSIKYALSMLKDGADGDSKTQIENIIGDYNPKKYMNSSNISLANAMFIRNDYKKNIKDEYVNLLKERYNAEIIYDAFETPSKINKWISDKTLGLIPYMLDDTNGNLLFLVNALGIDMDWKYVIQPVPEGTIYDKEHYSEPTPFSVSYPHENYYTGANWLDSNYYNYIKFNNQTLVNGLEIASSINNYDIVSELGEENIRKTVGDAYDKWKAEGNCDPIDYEDTNTFLNRYIKEIDEGYKDVGSSTDYSFYVDDDIKVFQKDLKSYNGLSLEYIGFMPKSTSLDKFVENIDTNKLNNYISKLKTIELNNFTKGKITRITGLMPIFKFEYELNLQKDLESLGVTNVFVPNHANLVNLSSDNSLYISEAKHKTNIEFSNEGIKAAAVSMVGGWGDTGCYFEYKYDVPVEEIDITFDKPYMFIIRDKDSKEVWFAGTVYEPISCDESKTCLRNK